MPTTTQTPALIALDWGTTRLRAYLLSGDGQVLETREDGPGIMRVVDGQFATALSQICSGWPPLPRIASGMIGSRQGWQEAPYLRCPANVAALGSQLLRVDSGAESLHLVPGVDRVGDDGVPDVMRGEETQILGALNPNASGELFVLPGTHSKWVLVERGSITWFCTFLSGELYQLLSEHSILGKMMSDPGSETASRSATVLARGVDAGRNGPLLRQLFSARTLALAGQLSADEVGDYLGGLIIGAEIRQALDACPVEAEQITLIASAALQTRYQSALTQAGLHAHAGPPHAAAAGLAKIAAVAGLV